MAKFSIVGTVMDADTNQKLSDAFITTDGTNNFTKSGDKGYYEIDFDSAKDNGLTVEKSGYDSITQRATKGKGDLTIIDIKLKKSITSDRDSKLQKINDLISDYSPKTNPNKSDNINVASKKYGKTNPNKSDNINVASKKYGYIAGGVTAVALGGVTYLLSKKFLDNKWGQLAVTATSAVIFYFVGFNVEEIINKNKKNNV
jgi:hypothetical protein